MFPGRSLTIVAQASPGAIAARTSVNDYCERPPVVRARASGLRVIQNNLNLMSNVRLDRILFLLTGSGREAIVRIFTLLRSSFSKAYLRLKIIQKITIKKKIIIDDLHAGVLENADMIDLFSKGSHHKNLKLLQETSRTMTRNADTLDNEAMRNARKRHMPISEIIAAFPKNT
ncbi:unnamed protein product [Trichogramma brassicae]|uniref:Uncharacterized protein n=1 Tax=Trichogramma brassicae TaxID=86971 RepID=A0A6H5HZ40_9HYME|nr:unnamed protein product [Trichogramma brassicae]